MKEDTRRLRTALILLLLLAIGIAFLVNGCNMIVRAIQELNTPTPPPVSQVGHYSPLEPSPAGFFLTLSLSQPIIRH